MTLRRLGFVLGFVFVLFPAIASADAHRAGIYGGVSGAFASKLLGAHTTFDLALGEYTTDSKYKYVNLIYDFSIHDGKHNDADLTIKTGLTGLGVRFARSSTSDHVFGGHFLVGGVSGFDDCFATAVGGLYEIVFHRSTTGWQKAIRVQYDYVGIKGDTDGFHRLSAGIDFRFKK